MTDTYPEPEQNPFVSQARAETGRFFPDQPLVQDTATRRVLSDHDLAAILRGDMPQAPRQTPATPSHITQERDQYLASLVQGNRQPRPHSLSRQPLTQNPAAAPQDPFSPRPLRRQLESKAVARDRPLMLAVEPSREVAVVSPRSGSALVPVEPTPIEKPSRRKGMPETAWKPSRGMKIGGVAGACVLAITATMAKTETSLPMALSSVKNAVGLGEAPNKVVYTAPDCDKPLTYANVQSTGDLLIRMKVFASLEEKAKLTADKKYKPQYAEGFFEDRPDAQQQSLPKQPFSKSGERVARLPQTVYAGRVGIAACITPDIGKVITPNADDPYQVTVNADQIQLRLIGDDTTNGSFRWSYERYPLEIKPELAANSPFPDGELQRQFKVLFPDAKDTKVMNKGLLSNVKANALEIFNAGGACDKWLTRSMQDALTTMLSEKAGHQVTVNWHGGFKSPKQNYLDTPDGMTAGGSKDFRVTNIQNTSKTCDESGSRT